jgi:hypothetical protein
MRRAALAFLVACLLLSVPAIAQQMSEDCTRLAKLFDDASKKDISSARLKRAREARARGGELCESGRGAGGARALKQALDYIGIET